MFSDDEDREEPPNRDKSARIAFSSISIIRFMS